MADDYSIQLADIPIARFKAMLATKFLIPSRLPVRVQIDERFSVIEGMGIDNVQQLFDAVKTKKRMQTFIDESGLPEAYVVLLRREVNSYVSKPVNLDKLPDVDADALARLAGVGVKTSKQLFERAKTPALRVELAQETALPTETILELACQSDLMRIIGVGPVGARLLYGAGIRDVAEFTALSIDESVQALNDAIESNPQYGTPKVKRVDMDYCMETAVLLPAVFDAGPA